MLPSSALENKAAASAVVDDALLIDQLRKTPFGQQLERQSSMNAVRARAQRELIELERRFNDHSVVALDQIAQLRTEREATKRAYEKADLAFVSAADRFSSRQEGCATLRAELKRVCEGAEAWLSSAGYLTAEDVTALVTRSGFALRPPKAAS